MSSIRAAIFDLGNVLINFDHRRAAERISAFTTKTPQQIYDLFFDSELTGLFEEGKISPEEFYRKVAETLESTISYQAFLPIWNEIFFLTPDNRKTLELARRVSSACAVCVLSNINSLHYDYIKEHFPIFSGFRAVFASCELRLRKPDARIYRRVAEMLGVELADCFYTDDRPELVTEAQSLGMHGYVYRSPEQLRRDLEAHELLVFSKNS